jgi:hypothetical protein
MNNVQDTTIEAWKQMQENLGYAQRQVMIAIGQYPGSTNNELAQILDWPINRITPRVNELRNPDKLGRWKRPLVIDGGKRRCKITGNMAHVWRVNPPIDLPPARAEKPEPSEVNNQSKLFPNA